MSTEQFEDDIDDIDDGEFDDDGFFDDEIFTDVMNSSDYGG